MSHEKTEAELGQLAALAASPGRCCTMVRDEGTRLRGQDETERQAGGNLAPAGIQHPQRHPRRARQVELERRRGPDQGEVERSVTRAGGVMSTPPGTKGNPLYSGAEVPYG